MKKLLNYTWLAVLIVGLLSGVYLYTLQTDEEGFDALGVDDSLVSESTMDRPTVFIVPATETENKNFVEKGALTKEGQFTYSSSGERVELRQLAKKDDKIKNGDINYHLKSVKLLVNSAKTMEAQQKARLKFNDQDLGRQYMTIQLQYNIENKSDKDVFTDGLVAVKFMNGSSATALSGLENDERLKAGIPAKSTVATGATVVVPASQRDQLQTMRLEFASIYDDQNGNLISPKTDGQKITF